jgi:hypothetical protein
MSELVAGLIGVVAGGLVTGAVELFQTWKDRQVKRRVAARLIAGDLMTAQQLVKLIVEKKRWPTSTVSFDAEYETWVAQREAFAAAVSAYDWNMVASVYEHLLSLAEAAGRGQPFTDDDRSSLEKDAKRLAEAIKITIARSASRREQRHAVRAFKKSPLSKRDT